MKATHLAALRAHTYLLREGEYLTLGKNHIMNNKTLNAKFTASNLGASGRILLGHGRFAPNGSFAELFSDRIVIHSGSLMPNPETIAHPLHIVGEVEISLRVGYGLATMLISTAGGSYETPEFPWQGRSDEIFFGVEGCSLTTVYAEWLCSDFDKPIWLFGDSYFNPVWDARWTSYMIKDGYLCHLMSGYPGRRTEHGLWDFKLALNYGTPKYAVWCLGMNNPDSEDAIDGDYLAATEEFIEICKEKGITPILSTTPETPIFKNTYKNEFVRKSGYRYIDFAAGVLAEEPMSPWGKGLLSADNIHPSPEGALALYRRFLLDFREITYDVV